MAKLGIMVKRILMKATFIHRCGNFGDALGDRDATLSKENGSNETSRNLDNELIPQPQTQSALLSKLPPEIRTLIWSELRQLDLDFVVEDDQVRLTLDCREEQLVSTLFACRQSYLETVEIIYSMCTFKFRHPNYFSQFHEMLPSKKIDSLQNLHLDWPLSEPPRFNSTVPRYYQSDLPRPVRPRLWQLDRLWKSVWLRLSTMKGLRRLYIRLDVPELWKDTWCRHEVDMFKSIPTINVPDFVISVSWDHMEPYPALNEKETKSLSFRIVRDT